MAYEDFTSFYEYDDNGKVSIDDANTISFTTLYRTDNAWIAKNYGDSYFDDFEIDSQFNITHINTDTHLGGVVLFGMKSYTNPNYYEPIATTQETWQYCNAIVVYAYNSSGTVIDLYLKDYHKNTSDFYSSIVTNTEYYLTVEKSGTTLTCKIYDDAPRTSLVDTLTIQTSTRPLSVLYAVGDHHYIQNRNAFYGTLSNFEIVSGGGGSADSPSEDGIEDFTSYTAVGSHVGIESESHVTCVNLHNRDKHYVYKDYGIDYLDGDFKYNVNSMITDMPKADYPTGGYGFIFWGIANAVGDLRTVGASGDKSEFLMFTDAGNGNLRVLLKSYASGDDDTYSNKSIMLGIHYYFTIERNHTTHVMTAKIYTDDARTFLLDTLTITCANTNWRYIYAMSSFYDSSYNFNRYSGETRFLKNMLPSVPTNPGEDGPVDNASNGEWPETDLWIDVGEQPGDVDVYFYDENGNEIGHVSDVPSGESAGVSYPGLDCEETYGWYVEIHYGDSVVTSIMWYFTCGTCDVFTIASKSYPTIHLLPPLWDTPERQINKNISRFGFWSENWAIHDNGIENEPLTLIGIEWINESDDESIFEKKFQDINAIMNLHEEVAISGVTDCIDGYYYIKNFNYKTVRGSVLARQWTLELEFSRERNW